MINFRKWHRYRCHYRSFTQCMLVFVQAGGCRVMAYAEHLATLCVSQPSASPLFPGFGVKKVKQSIKQLIELLMDQSFHHVLYNCIP